MRRYINHSGSGPYFYGQLRDFAGTEVSLNEGKGGPFLPDYIPSPDGGGTSISYLKSDIDGFDLNGFAAFVTFSKVSVPKFPNEYGTIR